MGKCSPAFYCGLKYTNLMVPYVTCRPRWDSSFSLLQHRFSRDCWEDLWGWTSIDIEECSKVFIFFFFFSTWSHTPLTRLTRREAVNCQKRQMVGKQLWNSHLSSCKKQETKKSTSLTRWFVVNTIFKEKTRGFVSGKQKQKCWHFPTLREVSLRTVWWGSLQSIDEASPRWPDVYSLKRSSEVPNEFWLQPDLDLDVQMGMDIPTSTYSCHSLFTFSHTWTFVCPCCPWETEWRGFHAVVFRVTAPPFGSHPRIQEHSFLELKMDWECACHVCVIPGSWHKFKAFTSLSCV